MFLYPLWVRNVIDSWMTYTIPIAISLSIVLISCSSDIGLLPFLVWLHLPVYLFHQAEEYVLPGGFKEKFDRMLHGLMFENREVHLSDEHLCFINVVLVWGMCTVFAILAQHVSMAFGVIQSVFLLSNGIVHVFFAIKERSYNPGTITSIVFFIPLTVYTLYQLHCGSCITFARCGLALFFSIGVHAAIVFFVMMKKDKALLKK